MAASVLSRCLHWSSIDKFLIVGFYGRLRGIQYIFVPASAIYGMRTLADATFRFVVRLFIVVFSVMITSTFVTSWWIAAVNGNVECGEYKSLNCYRKLGISEKVFQWDHQI